MMTYTVNRDIRMYDWLIWLIERYGGMMTYMDNSNIRIYDGLYGL